ncbi:MAG: hypothetical protein FWD76_01710 [Firmicutes bacterium]|nr:hypothetical protein [Bacillota bacterium]
MSTTFTLIKMNIRQSLRIDRAKNKPLTIAKWLLTAVFGLAILAVFVAMYVLLNLKISFGFSVTDPSNGERLYTTIVNEFFTFTFLIFHILQFLFLLPILMKHLKIGDDREILMRMPITSRQLLVAKLTTIYILEILFAAFVLLPILIAFGVFSNFSGSHIGALYWGMIPILLIIAPIFPFLMGVLLLFPINIMSNFIKSRHKLMLGTYLVLGIGTVIVYMFALSKASFLILNKGLKDQMAENYWTVHNWASAFFYHKMFANAVLDANPLSLGAMFGSSIVLAGIALLVAIKLYKYYYNQDVSKTKTVKLASKEGVMVKPQTSYLIKEFKTIVRSSNYSFQFLVFVVIMPIVVLMCSRLAGISTLETFKSSGSNLSDLTGAQRSMMLGVSLLSFLIIMPLASSFAAIGISREGGNIYACKVLPIKYRHQVLIKMLLCFVPIVVSTIIGLGLIRIPQKIINFTIPKVSWSETLWLFYVVVSMALGLICMGMLLDLKKPVCKAVGSGEITKTNKAAGAVLLVGLIFAMLSSTPLLLQQILPRLPLKIIIAGLTTAFAGTMFALLWFFCEKLFARVEAG